MSSRHENIESLSIVIHWMNDERIVSSSIIFSYDMVINMNWTRLLCYLLSINIYLNLSGDEFWPLTIHQFTLCFLGMQNSNVDQFYIFFFGGWGGKSLFKIQLRVVLITILLQHMRTNHVDILLIYFAFYFLLWTCACQIKLKPNYTCIASRSSISLLHYLWNFCDGIVLFKFV